MSVKSVCTSWGIIRPDRLEKRRSKRVSTGEELGLLANIAGQLDLDGLDIHQETLPIGHRSSPPHRHTTRVEIIYVLEGSPSVSLDGREKCISTGEFVIFKPTDAKYHMIFNDGKTDAKLLVISFNGESDEVIFPAEQLDIFGYSRFGQNRIDRA